MIKGAVRRTGVTAAQDVEALHAQLGAISKLGDDVVVVFVEAAHEEMLSGTEAGEFAAALDTLGSGGDPETNEERALFLLAERGGGTPTSREHVGLYGFTNHTMIIPAFERLRRR